MQQYLETLWEVLVSFFLDVLVAVVIFVIAFYLGCATGHLARLRDPSPSPRQSARLTQNDQCVG